MKLETIEQKRAKIAKQLARENANRKLLNQIKRFEYVKKSTNHRLHPWGASVGGIGF